MEQLIEDISRQEIPNPSAKAIKQIPLAVVGLRFGCLIIKWLQRPDLKELFRIHAVCDLDQARAIEVASEIGARSITFDELLVDHSLPAVALFTAPNNRAQLIRLLIGAGKHVMTTKPFERDPEAGRLILEEATQMKQVVHLNSPTPDLPADLAQIKAWQTKYNLGRPLAAQASTWTRYQEAADGRWYDDARKCPAAPIFRLGIYLINDLVESFGEAETVHLMTSRIFTGRPTPDHAQLAIRFQSGALATILASFCVGDNDHYRNSLVLNFENGTIYRNAGAEGKDASACKLAVVVPRDREAVVLEEVTYEQTSGDYQWGSFHRAICEGIFPPSDYPKKVTAGLRIVEAMAESERTGLTIPVKKV